MEGYEISILGCLCSGLRTVGCFGCERSRLSTFTRPEVYCRACSVTSTISRPDWRDAACFPRAPSCRAGVGSNTAGRTSAPILLRVPARRPPVLRPLAKGHLSKCVYFRVCLQEIKILQVPAARSPSPPRMLCPRQDQSGRPPSRNGVGQVSYYGSRAIRPPIRRAVVVPTST